MIFHKHTVASLSGNGFLAKLRGVSSSDSVGAARAGQWVSNRKFMSHPLISTRFTTKKKQDTFSAFKYATRQQRRSTGEASNSWHGPLTTEAKMILMSFDSHQYESFHLNYLLS